VTNHFDDARRAARARSKHAKERFRDNLAALNLPRRVKDAALLITTHMMSHTDFQLAWPSYGCIAATFQIDKKAKDKKRYRPKGVERIMRVIRELGIFTIVPMTAAGFRQHLDQHGWKLRDNQYPNCCHKLNTYAASDHPIWSQRLSAEQRDELCRKARQLLSAAFHRKPACPEIPAHCAGIHNPPETGPNTRAVRGAQIPAQCAGRPHGGGKDALAESQRSFPPVKDAPTPQDRGRGSAKSLPREDEQADPEVQQTIDLLVRLEETASLEKSKLDYQLLALRFSELELPTGWLEEDLLTALASKEFAGINSRSWAVFLSPTRQANNRASFQHRLQEQVCAAVAERLAAQQRAAAKAHAATAEGIFERFCRKEQDFLAEELPAAPEARLGLLLGMLALNGRLPASVATLRVRNYVNGAAWSLSFDPPVLTDEQRGLLRAEWLRFAGKLKATQEDGEKLIAKLASKRGLVLPPVSVPAVKPPVSKIQASPLLDDLKQQLQKRGSS
jgi:hypothetical protein